jgi:hypothetical protein
MSALHITQLTDQLADVLERLIQLHEVMHDGIRAKLEAMRRADVEAMLTGARIEGEIADQVELLSAERLRVVSSLCTSLKLPVAPAAASLRMLASRLEGVERDRLLRLAARLREEMVKVGEANRTVEFVCREMLLHFKTLFTCMVRGADAPEIYHRDGDLGGVCAPAVLDAVG